MYNINIKNNQFIQHKNIICLTFFFLILYYNMKKKHTILDEYIKRNNQIIILIIGMLGSYKSIISKSLNETLNLKLINMQKFLNKKEYKKINIEKNEYHIYDINENYDWNEINKLVNENKQKGIILYGSTIDENKIDFKIDFTFYLSVNKTILKNVLIEKKIIKNEKNINDYIKNYYIPYYEQLINKIKIDKIINIKNNEQNVVVIETYVDKIFDVLMIFIKNIIYKKN